MLYENSRNKKIYQAKERSTVAFNKNIVEEILPAKQSFQMKKFKL